MTETLVKDEVVRRRPMAPVRSSIPAVTGITDLVEYARKHRYRVRNLHDGGPVAPARWKPPQGYRPVYVGKDDRWDAIVGYAGYVAFDGCDLSVFLFFKSNRGVTSALKRLKAIGARIDQIGDTEVGAFAPVERIEEVLKLIQVSKLRRGDAQRFKNTPTQERCAL
ncbi:MAG: hypothetical protein JSU86_11055 [Phycisphaerales bacterium]|nr:MAG: hypothetical protein JSU86_11055 [Phycisphaerales bacterium]